MPGGGKGVIKEVLTGLVGGFLKKQQARGEKVTKKID